MSHHLLAQRLYALHAELLAAIAARFPGLCPARVEDAVSGVYETFAREPERFQQALETGGIARMKGLATLMARRDARDQLQRCSYRLERTQPGGYPDWAACPRMEPLLDFHAHLLSEIQEISEEVCGQKQKALSTAILEKLETGEEDAVIAARFGLRREHVNRAWNRLRARYLAA